MRPIAKRIPPKIAGLSLVVALLAGALLVFSGLDTSSPQASDRAKPAPGTPVVIVVYDELPTATLMNRTGTRIDAKRFPAFARLAAHSTWYRNNTTVADFTGRALPAIETGINPGYNTLPIASQQPNSIFTMLGRDYRFNVSEPVTRVCPASLCGKEKGRGPGPVHARSAGHFTQGLFEKPRPKLFSRFLRRLRGGRTFNFIHFELPHEPFHFLPDGRSYNYTPISDVGNHNGQKWSGGAGGTATTWQRHFIQTGYADTLTSRLIRRMRQVGIWNEALLIVVADHGISFDPGTFRRIAFPGNFAGVANPPLFIRYPGQRAGAVSDAHTRTLDVVPTVARVLGIEVPYRADGEPISADGSLDGSGTGTVTVSSALRRSASDSFVGMQAERETVLRRQATALGSRTGLFQLGPRAGLIGRRAPRVSRRAARLDPGLELDRLRNDRGKVPAFVNGTAPPRTAGKVIAIALNGRVAATCRAFRFRGRTRWGAIVPPSRLRPGGNSVGVYLVRGRRLVSLGGA